ncbi:MAG: hypothetical protein KDD67_07795 [Ignavibacteriae bacterium]|nr:hypothetical protein [Ignavibacteriota bacterium]MCB9215899.1 hypothetical protein [Ignavibacteria bacterium]
MNTKKRQFVILTSIAGVLFLIVGAYDLFFSTEGGKSNFVIALEVIAGLCFVLNGLIQWRKSR